MLFIVSFLIATYSFAGKGALDIVDARPVGKSISLDQPLIELLSKPYNEEKVTLLGKYGIKGSQKGTSEFYHNARNKYNTLAVKRDPQGNLLTIAHTFPTKSGIQSELLNVPKRSVTFCGFNLKGKPTGCLTQSQYVCNIMQLRNRDQYMIDQAAVAHREGVRNIQDSLPGSYRRKVGKYGRAFSRIPNSLEPKNRDAMLQVCQTHIAYLDQTFGGTEDRAVVSAEAPVAVPAAAPVAASPAGTK